MAQPLSVGYTVDDLDLLRGELGVAHLELDLWGSLIVSPSTDEHAMAVAILSSQADRQLGLPPGCVRVNSLAWKVPDGSGYMNIPDVAVVVPGWERVGDYHLQPAPLLVVEVASPSTRRADRGRKLADYRLGGAGLYVLVDLPPLAPGPDAVFTAHYFASDQVETSTETMELEIQGRPLRFDLGVVTR